MTSKVLNNNLMGVHLVSTFLKIRSHGCQSADFIQLRTWFQGRVQYCIKIESN